MVAAGDVDLWHPSRCFAKELRASTVSWIRWRREIGFAWRPVAAVFLWSDPGGDWTEKRRSQ